MTFWLSELSACFLRGPSVWEIKKTKNRNNSDLMIDDTKCLDFFFGCCCWGGKRDHLKCNPKVFCGNNFFARSYCVTFPVPLTIPFPAWWLYSTHITFSMEYKLAPHKHLSRVSVTPRHRSPKDLIMDYSLSCLLTFWYAGFFWFLWDRVKLAKQLDFARWLE